MEKWYFFILILMKNLKLFNMIKHLSQKQQLKTQPAFAEGNLKRLVKVRLPWLTKYRPDID